VHGRGPENAAGDGTEPFKAFLRQIRTAFPDIRITVEETIENGDRVAVRCRVAGTNTGPGLAPTPTGKRIDIGGMCSVHIRGGQIVQGWNNFDFLAMYQQLGVPPF
jgi:predicted ester cyclase